MAKEINVGMVFYFGHKNTPNKVTRVINMQNHNQFSHRVYLKGPRGGEYIAYVRHDGSCVKI